MITTCIVLLVNTVEGNWVENERQHSPSNTYLSTPLGERASKTLFPPSWQPASFSCIPEFLDQKCPKFSSEFNGTNGKSL